MKGWFGELQKIGKALMLPVAVLPAAALLLRFGADDLLNSPFIMKAGGALFENLALLFAIGIAVGIAHDNNGAAGLSGCVGYLVLTNGVKAIDPKLNMSVLGGIVAGLVAGYLYNRYYNIKLPDYLQFFGGRRFVPLVTAASSVLLAGIFGLVIWAPLQAGIHSTGEWIIGAGAFGVFIYGVLNRLLILVGLHHVLNSFIWFVFGNYTDQTGKVVTGDLNRFFAGDPTAGIFMAGMFVIFMFGLPAVALAIYHQAKPQNRAAIGGMLFSVAFTAFLTGITEPIEFMFVFLAPMLYVLHAILTGAALAVTYSLGILHGFGFSAGLTDYLLNWKFATKPLMIIPVGLAFGVVYYLVFSWAIKTFNLPTPGRYDEEETTALPNMDVGTFPTRLLEKLGGAENLQAVDSCITRLRLKVKDADVIKEEEIKAIGAGGLIRHGNNVQVIVGIKAELIADEIKKLLQRNKNIQA
ncbi:PTS system N-acetylglucosamine-specific EIICBA component [Sporomusa rhizae]|uniref:N-acetylglucosamine-specific PTS transporter subunit IIBC n=1 Tax=Sporomusa rhizae TaxID=357999 RepID=UPI00352A41EC